MMCVGMEKIITTEVTLQVKQRQAKHLQTILVEQLRQDILGVVDMEALSRLSHSSSEWTRCRAHKYAAAYWDLFLEEE